MKAPFCFGSSPEPKLPNPPKPDPRVATALKQLERIEKRVDKLEKLAASIRKDINKHADLIMMRDK